jgi:hypothetical protein
MEDAATLFSTYVDKRKARYTAQALEIFEDKLESVLKKRGLMADPEIRAAVDEVKATFRTKIRELATDATEAMTLTGTDFRVNEAARELTEPLFGDANQGAATT